MSLAGSSVIVSGAASGIGRATAERFLELGTRVGAIDRTEPAGPPGALSLVADVRDQQAVAEAVNRAADAHGGIDVVVCSAGIDHIGAIDETGMDVWQRLYDVNVIGMARVLSAAVPHLRRSERASVVLVASAVASVGLRNRAAYTATKGAVVAMTRSLAAEFAPYGIRVVSVSPGTIATPLLQVVNQNRYGDEAPDLDTFFAEAAERQPLGKIGTPEEVARTISFMADHESGLLTGANLLIDGGMTGIYPTATPAAAPRSEAAPAR